MTKLYLLAKAISIDSSAAKIVAIRGAVIFKVVNSGNFIFSRATNAVNGRGIFNIPLDMMTITIAAITIGIAVDNSIHYIYRFREEFAKLKNYNKTIKICHSTVGVAIINTSITIVVGFSILVFSNFIPTIYFGVFTGVAMMFAMLLVLTLLPCLLTTFKPFGIEK